MIAADEIRSLLGVLRQQWLEYAAHHRDCQVRRRVQPCDCGYELAAIEFGDAADKVDALLGAEPDPPEDYEGSQLPTKPEAAPQQSLDAERLHDRMAREQAPQGEAQTARARGRDQQSRPEVGVEPDPAEPNELLLLNGRRAFEAGYEAAMKAEQVGGAAPDGSAPPLLDLITLVEDFNGWWGLNREGSLNAAYAQIDAFTKQARALIERSDGGGGRDGSAPSETAWHPIATAPNGSDERRQDVLVVVDIDGRKVVGEARLHEDGWYWANECSGDYHASPIWPECWMPLPDPPSAAPAPEPK